MKYGRWNPIPDDAPRFIERECNHHGLTSYVLFTRSQKTGKSKGYRCVRCNAENKERHRNRIRDALLSEAGGHCVLCGYDRCRSALQFHHRDPMTKEFELSKISTNLERARKEAAKCVLLCGNCHAEVEVGYATLM